MKQAFDNLSIEKNTNSHRFELIVEGYTAFIDYKERGNIITLIHTESPEELKGRGVATALIEKTLHYLKDNSYALVPLCPLVFAYIKRHPDWIDIVRDDFKDRF